MLLFSLFSCHKLDAICSSNRPGEIPLFPTQTMEVEVELRLIGQLREVTRAAGGAAESAAGVGKITHLLVLCLKTQ